MAAAVLPMIYPPDRALCHLVLDVFKFQVDDNVDAYIDVLQHDHRVHLRDEQPLLPVFGGLHLLEVLALRDVDVLAASLYLQVQVHYLLCDLVKSLGGVGVLAVRLEVLPVLAGLALGLLHRGKLHALLVGLPHDHGRP